jgi:hypothetical protein
MAVLPAAPCTISMAASRTRFGAAAVWPRPPAGTIASRNGRATVTPMPLQHRPAGMCFLVMIIASPRN